MNEIVAKYIIVNLVDLLRNDPCIKFPIHIFNCKFLVNVFKKFDLLLLRICGSLYLL